MTETETEAEAEAEAESLCDVRRCTMHKHMLNETFIMCRIITHECHLTAQPALEREASDAACTNSNSTRG